MLEFYTRATKTRTIVTRSGKITTEFINLHCGIMLLKRPCPKRASGEGTSHIPAKTHSLEEHVSSAGKNTALGCVDPKTTKSQGLIFPVFLVSL